MKITNDLLELQCKSDAMQVIIRDKKRGVTWRLDELTRCYWSIPEESVKLVEGGKAIELGGKAIRQDFNIDGNKFSYLWELFEDGLAITLSFENEYKALQAVALPGSFLPDDQALRLALPISQGVLFDGRGEPFEETLLYGGNVALSMAMMGYLAEQGGLLICVENQMDWNGIVGKRDDGNIYAYVNQVASLDAMRYSRSVRLYFTDADVTALCKRYRRRIQELGSWKSWDEKIAERPSVERLFGSLMTFIGYNQGEFDYVAECKKLRDFGFERAFIYPLRFCVYSNEFRMGGDPPIYLADTDIEAIKRMGYDVAVWAWVNDALDDGGDRIGKSFRQGRDGKRILSWKMDNIQFYRCCTPFQIELVKNAYAGFMKDMTGIQFDVNANYGAQECRALDHAGHTGMALDRRGDLQLLRELLGPGMNGNRIVASEGFAEIFADIYDIAAMKLDPSYEDMPFWSIPMTMLVYHDSVIHDWWVLQNYNHHDACFFAGVRWGKATSGNHKEKAAMDALYGSPPNVFPFGRQYTYIDWKTRNTRSFSVHFEDASVQEALKSALPVTKLHRGIGKLEMLSHEFLLEDGTVQATVFSDGTRVIANFSDKSQEVQGAGCIPAKSWKSIN